MSALEQVQEGRRLWSQVRSRYPNWLLPANLTLAEYIRLGEEPAELSEEFGATLPGHGEVLVSLNHTDIPLYPYIGECDPLRATVWQGIYPQLDMEY